MGFDDLEDEEESFGSGDEDGRVEGMLFQARCPLAEEGGGDFAELEGAFEDGHVVVGGHGGGSTGCVWTLGDEALETVLDMLDPFIVFDESEVRAEVVVEDFTKFFVKGFALDAEVVDALHQTAGHEEVFVDDIPGSKRDEVVAVITGESMSVENREHVLDFRFSRLRVAGYIELLDLFFLGLWVVKVVRPHGVEDFW